MINEPAEIFKDPGVETRVKVMELLNANSALGAKRSPRHSVLPLRRCRSLSRSSNRWVVGAKREAGVLDPVLDQ